MKLTGTKEIAKALGKLPKELQRSAESAVLREGAKPIAKAAKSRVPVASGLLKKSIGSRVRTIKGETSARIGPRTGMKQTVTRNGRQVISDPNKYSHLVEFGTSKTAAQPFIRPAVDSAGGEVIEAMAKGYEKHLTKVVAKLRRK